MKIFHLSDLHIGLKLFNRDLREDQEYILKQIADLAKKEQPDVVVVAGDIFDRAIPSAESYEVFDRFTEELTEAVPNAKIMMISGNHDSAPRVNVYRSILARHNFYMIGNPPEFENEHIEKIVVEDAYGFVNFYLLPFVKPSMVKMIVGTDESGNNLSYDASIHKLIEREGVNTDERNVFVSHQFYLPKGKRPDEIERMESEIKAAGNIDEVSADVLECFDYVALGHIHKPMKVGSEVIRYCGTPMACSVSEAGQQKGIIVVEMGEKNEISTSVIPLKPLHEIKVVQGSLEEVLGCACDDYVSVVLTDKVDYDTIDMRERINKAFPNLLQLRRDIPKLQNDNLNRIVEKEMEPFELCCEFLADQAEEYKELLQDVINTVGEGL